MDAKKLKVLDPKLSADKRSQVQEKMISPDVLDPERYPDIRFRSTDVQQKGNEGLAVTGNLTLHGQTRPVVVNVTGRRRTIAARRRSSKWSAGRRNRTLSAGRLPCPRGLGFMRCSLDPGRSACPETWSLCRRMRWAGVRFTKRDEVVVDYYPSRLWEEQQG